MQRGKEVHGKLSCMHCVMVMFEALKLGSFLSKDDRSLIQSKCLFKEVSVLVPSRFEVDCNHTVY